MPFKRLARAFLVASMDVAYFVFSSSWRCFTACQSASSMMRSSGTSVTIQSSRGLIRGTLLPVSGFFAKRNRFQIKRPM